MILKESISPRRRSGTRDSQKARSEAEIAESDMDLEQTPTGHVDRLHVHAPDQAIDENQLSLWDMESVYMSVEAESSQVDAENPQVDEGTMQCGRGEISFGATVTGGRTHWTTIDFWDDPDGWGIGPEWAQC